jgi:hypothetical protein
MAINNLNSGVGIQPTIVDAKGDLIVATGADAVNRLAVGTANQQLVVDSSTSTGLKWAAPAGLVLLNTTSFSGVASQRVNPFSATYQNYRLVIQLAQTNGTPLKFRLAAGASVLSTSTYRQAAWYQEGSTSGNYYNTSSETSVVVNDKANAAFSIDIFRPFDAATTALTFNLAMENGSVLGAVIGAGYNTNATSYDGFELSPNTGNMTGTLRVYGYNQ